MRFLLKATLISCSVLLLLQSTAAVERLQGEELVVEKKTKYIPAGSGQKPFDVTRHVIALGQIQSAGPRKNGIPPLDHPAFLSASEADPSLKAQDIILGVQRRGQGLPRADSKLA